MLMANAALLASAAAIAVASSAYAVCLVSVRRANAQFALGMLEEFELERAVLLYEKMVDRLQDIRNEGRQMQAGLLARYRHRKQAGQKFAAVSVAQRAGGGRNKKTQCRLRRGVDVAAARVSELI